LPSFFVAQTQEERERLILCLVLAEKNVQALLLQVSASSVEIVSQSQVLVYEDLQQCLAKTDEALQALGDESETVNQVVFALDPDWVEDGELVASKQQIIERLTKDLSLEPIGFIVTAEALAHSLVGSKTHFSGFACIFSSEMITMVGLVQGKIVGVEQVGRSLEPLADFVEGLARFQSKSKDHPLPASIILTTLELSGGEVKELQQDLLGASWPTEVSFYQTPTVEVMAATEYLKVIAQAVGKAAAAHEGWLSGENSVVQRPARQSDLESDMGEAVSEIGESELELVDDGGGYVAPASLNSTLGVKIEEEKAIFDEVDAEEKFSDKSDSLWGRESGDIEDVDEIEDTATSFGIPISPSSLVGAPKLEVATAKAKPTEADLEDEALEAQQMKKKKMYKVVFLSFLSGLFTLFLLAFVWVSVATEVEVRVVLSTKSLSQDIDITLDEKLKESDVEKLIIAAQTVTTTVSDEIKVPTTGVKIVGEKAEGTVTIFNKTEADKTFGEGTAFKAGDFEFTLNSEVTVASASVKPKPGGEEKEFGKKDAAVTAKAIGAESNLAKETKLVVATFATSTYEAQAVSAFTGGSSREVRVVAEKDRTEAVLALEEELVEKANQQLVEETSEDLYLAPTNTVVSREPQFSAETGTEADELKIKLTLKVSALAYHADDLIPIAYKVLSERVPDGYELLKTPPQIISAASATQSANTTQSVVLSANLTSQSRRVLDEELVRQLVVGKKSAEAVALLEREEGVKAVELVFSPRLATWLRNRLPTKSEKILLRIVEPND
jgi:hypothetical protein